MNRRASLARAVATCTRLAGAALALAQSNTPGVYTGTAVVSGTGLGQGSVAFSASVKVSLPLISANGPDVQPWKGLPFTNAAHLAAKHKFVPVSHINARNGALDQTWNLRLVR